MPTQEHYYQVQLICILEEGTSNDGLLPRQGRVPQRHLIEWQQLLLLQEGGSQRVSQCQWVNWEQLLLLVVGSGGCNSRLGNRKRLLLLQVCSGVHHR